MLIYIDEHKLYDKIPTFVAINPDNLPSAKLSEGDLQCILNKLTNISTTMTSFNGLLLNSANTFTVGVVAELEHRLVALNDTTVLTKLQDSIDVVQKQTAHLDSGFADGVIHELEHRLAPLSNSVALHKLQDSLDVVRRQTACLERSAFSAAQTSTILQPHSHQQSSSSYANNHTGSSQLNSNLVPVTHNTHRTMSIASCSGEPATVSDSNVFTDVINNRKGKASLINNSNINKQNVTYAGAVVSNNSSTNQPTLKQTQPKRRTVLGASNTCTLKASQNPQIKKSVFKISNLDYCCTVSDVNDYVTNLKVRILTCFELPKGKFEKDGNKSFRVCIYSNDKAAFLSKDNWSSGILIKEWVFRPKDQPSSVAPNSEIIEPVVPCTLESVSSYNSASNTQTMQTFYFYS